MAWVWVPEEVWEARRRREGREPLGHRVRKVRRRLAEWMKGMRLIQPGVAK